MIKSQKSHSRYEAACVHEGQLHALTEVKLGEFIKTFLGQTGIIIKKKNCFASFFVNSNKIVDIFSTSTEEVWSR